MYFPFFASEVKCGAAALDVADRHNARSITLAVRGFVELFRPVRREKELHRGILAFSISHDNETVRIYGHYPVIEGKKTTFYRHTIRKFDFTEQDGIEKWTAYKFTKSVYDTWMPAHFKWLCSAIDAIPPDIHFELSEESDPQFSFSSGLSPGLESHHLSESGATGDDELSFLDPEKVAPETSVSKHQNRRRSRNQRRDETRPVFTWMENLRRKEGGIGVKSFRRYYCLTSCRYHGVREQDWSQWRVILSGMVYQCTQQRDILDMIYCECFVRNTSLG
jgi:hypothetical protein